MTALTSSRATAYSPKIHSAARCTLTNLIEGNASSNFYNDINEYNNISPNTSGHVAQILIKTLSKKGNIIFNLVVTASVNISFTHFYYCVPQVFELVDGLPYENQNVLRGKLVGIGQKLHKHWDDGSCYVRKL